MKRDTQNIDLGPMDDEGSVGEELSDEQLVQISDEFDREMIHVLEKTQMPFVLAPVGMIASGKTTTIRALAEYFSLVIVRTDDIRDFLKDRGFNFRRTVEIAMSLAVKYVKLGYGVALDADIVSPYHRSALGDLCDRFEIPVISIHVKTPEEVILKRLHAGNPDRDYKGQEAIERYFERKPLHRDIDIDFDYEFAGDGDLDSQVHESIGAIEKKLNPV